MNEEDIFDPPLLPPRLFADTDATHTPLVDDDDNDDLLSRTNACFTLACHLFYLFEFKANDMWASLFLTTVSGLSTGFGGFAVLMFGNPDFWKLGHMLSFSAGVMVYISFMDLLPEAVEEIGFFAANFWFFVGMAVFTVIIWLVPEPDVSALHKKDDDDTSSKASAKHAHLLMVGVIAAVGISIHNLPEGVGVYLACMKGAKAGLPLTVAIAAHNIPEGMAVAAPIYHSTGSKWQAIKWAFLSGACEPLGAVIFGMLFTSWLTPVFINSCLAAVAGVMVLMSFRELIPTTLKYIQPEQAIYSLVTGMMFIFLSAYSLRWSFGLLNKA
ncbi:Zinc transporter ZupT [Balamuthia mandrillaris]